MSGPPYVGARDGACEIEGWTVNVGATLGASVGERLGSPDGTADGRPDGTAHGS